MILIFLTFSFTYNTDAQVLKRLADRAKDKIERKAGDKIEKGIDDAVDGNGNKKDKKKADSNEGSNSSTGNESSPGNNEAKSVPDTEVSSSTATEEDKPAKPQSLETYSKYDFVPGEKVIAFEDFSTTEVGDFPVRWNTNASGEVVTLNNGEGKWFKISKEGAFHPEFITDIPDNFTLEFDLGVNDNWNSYPFSINIAKLKSPQKFTDYDYYIRWQNDHLVQLHFTPARVASRSSGNSEITAGSNNSEALRNRVTFSNWDNKSNKFAHVSIWRQKQRLRVYLNGEKIWDIPRAFGATDIYNAVTIGTHRPYQKDDFFLLKNLRLAVGAPDTRNKLITEGRFTTSGILFDVNSAQIQAESYGTLKDIANVLKENSTVKVRVIGHTDTDGDDKTNMELSKKRAASVKDALIKEFGLDASRIETDGKGESQPVDKADTPVAKANNRRVEFVKL